MSGRFDWKAFMDGLPVDAEPIDPRGLSRLSMDSFIAENRGITVAELRAERDAARAERRAEIERALDELMYRAGLLALASDRLTGGTLTDEQYAGWKPFYTGREEARQHVLALIDALDADGG